MKYVLDTNTLSYAMAGEPQVCSRLLALPRTDVLLPQPVVAEVEYGLARMHNSKRRERLFERLRIFLDELARAEWTDAVSRAFGATKADLERRGVRIEDFDVAIAAHALALDAVLVSDDSAHMSRITGLQVESWRTNPGLTEPGGE